MFMDSLKLRPPADLLSILLRSWHKGSIYNGFDYGHSKKSVLIFVQCFKGTCLKEGLILLTGMVSLISYKLFIQY